MTGTHPFRSKEATCREHRFPSVRVSLSIPMCGYTLFTDHPLHIAAGSMPPQNGFGLGGAFVWTKNIRNWRLRWDFDAVGATSGAWRAGVSPEVPSVGLQDWGIQSPGAAITSLRRDSRS